jgi:shikimate dehydrogenase
VSERPITGHTRVVGLLGGDVRYSLSLRLHNEAFASLGLDWVYLPLPVTPGDETRLVEAVRGMRAMGFVGANVTMPFKEAVIPYLDEITPAAARIGAVNTVRIDGAGRLIGGNTDSAGFISDLSANGVSLPGRPVVILGAGGAARAVAFGLAERGCGPMIIANRTSQRADRLREELARYFPAQRVTVTPWPLRADNIDPDALIVNCTPVGMHNVRTPTGADSPWPIRFSPDQVVVDLVYAPLVTPMLAAARADGARALTGLGMLVQQAALSFAWWTDEAPPVRQMRAALEEA